MNKMIPVFFASCTKHAFRYANRKIPAYKLIVTKGCPSVLRRWSSSSNGALLEGVRVLDMTRVLAGPYCTMILGDMGADVIKVERPGQGDDTRSWGPPFCGEESAYFLSINRNKRSITVDIKSNKGVDIIKRLAEESDVLVENYLPGKLDEMGLGYRDLQNVAPKLIYCSISGYGQTGPHANRPGYDVIVSGVGGLMGITGPMNGDPCKVGVAITDLSTGLYAHGAIIAALMHCRKTGKGQHIDCNLLSTQVSSLVNIASNYLNSGKEARRHGTAHESIVPYQAFKTSDGYYLVGAGNNKQFKVLCKTLGLEKLIDKQDYCDNRKRVENRESLLAILSDIFITESSGHWERLLKNTDIPCGHINNMQQVFADEQVVHNEMIQEMSHPTAGTIRVPGPAVRYSESNTVLKYPPPTLGEHTDVVLRDVLRIPDNEITQLKRDGVV